ncbi:MAG: nitronate monooxygenase [Candidatus Latescibacterota bacterium]
MQSDHPAADHVKSGGPVQPDKPAADHMKSIALAQHDKPATNQLNKLWKRGQDLLGVEYPIMCGAMIWVSDPNLVAHVSEAGAFASLACGNIPPEVLEEDIEKTRSLGGGEVLGWRPARSGGGR